MFLKKRKEKIRLAAPSHTGYDFNKTIMLLADERIQVAISFNFHVQRLLLKIFAVNRRNLQQHYTPFRAGLQPTYEIFLRFIAKIFHSLTCQNPDFGINYSLFLRHSLVQTPILYSPPKSFDVTSHPAFRLHVFMKTYRFKIFNNTFKFSFS